MNISRRIYGYVFSMVLLASACEPLPADAAEIPAPGPLLPVPSQAQLKWHQAEYRMFIHFGMKTFYPSDNHMGDGKEDPKRFNPILFDANQWVAAAKAGGFEGIVLTAKHHDGFCNWPTETTPHSVKSSPWKHGKGDVVCRLAEACRKGGLSFGIYLSILDHNYNYAGSAKYDNYDDLLYDQLQELSTNYGQIDVYWLDGFMAKNLKVDYEKIAQLIKDKQPNAVVFDAGALVAYLPDRCLRWPSAHGGVEPDQNYKHKVGDIVCWYPNDSSLMLQGNWFHNGQPIVSLDCIKDFYLQSVGHGVTSLMNVSPNQVGLIDEETIEHLKAFKAWVDALHANDLARGEAVKVNARTVRGDAPRFAADKVNDGDFETYYATDDNVKTACLEIDLGKVQEVDGFILQEYIPLGQRVEAYSIECMIDGNWVEVFAGRRIGYQRIILEGYATAAEKKFPATDRVRLNIKNALACPLISTFQVIGKTN